MIDTTRDRPLAQDNIERLISELRAEADAAHFSDLAEPAIARASRPSLIDRLRTRAAAVTAALVLIFGGGGAAFAANGAAPGDLLYGLDRALEAVGIGNGSSAERLEEVKTLVEQGHADHGLEHATNIVSEDPGAQAALLAAAERISGLDRTAAHESVAPLLTYLSENVGSVDGATVAELARAVGGNDAPGPPEGTPGGPPEGVPPGGPPEGVSPGGPPEGVPPGGPPENRPPVTPPVTTP